MISISAVHPLRFNRKKKENAFSPLGVTGKLDFPKVADFRSYGDFHACSTFCRFGLVRRRTHFVYYGSLERSIFQKLSGTAEITCVILTSMSVVLFVSFAL